MNQPPLESLSYLPAFVREQLESNDEDFVGALLEFFEENIHQVEHRSARSSLLFDPEGARWFPVEQSAASGQWEWRLLQWLATWLALDADEIEVVGGVGHKGLEQVREDSAAVVEKNCRQAATLITQAAAFYRQRGTPRGLENAILARHGWSVKVVERSWPVGMVIGSNSVIGAGSWMLNQPPEEATFTVLISAANPELRKVVPGEEHLHSKLGGEASGVEIEWAWGRGAKEAATFENQVSEEFGRAMAISTLRKALDREKPAHTQYFLAWETLSAPLESPGPKPFVIEANSVIGVFLVN